MSACLTFNIPKDWSLVPLKAISEYKVSPVDKIKKDDEVDVLLCNYTDVYKNTYITSDIEFMEGSATKEEIQQYKIQYGDILITKDSEDWQDIGIPAMVKENFENVICGYHLAIIRPHRQRIHPKFLYYCFEDKNLRLQIELAATGVTRFGIPKLAIGSYKIPLPSLSHQNKIVDYLDAELSKIDKLITQKNQLLNLLEEKKKAIISRAVTRGIHPNVKLKNSGIDWLGEVPEHWRIIKLKYLVNKIDKRDNNEDVSFKVAVENIQSFTGQLTGLENFDYSGGVSLFKKDDVIFNKLRPYLAKVYLATQGGGVYGELLILRANKGVLPKFIFYSLINKYS